MPANRRLLYIINSLDIGGAEIGMCRLLDGLDQDAYDVTIVALSGQSGELTDRIPEWVDVLDLSVTSSPSLSALREFFSLVRSTDVIVGSLFHSAMVARAVGVFNRDATVATWQHADRFASNTRQKGYVWTAGLSDVILADSEPVAEMLVAECGLDEDHVATVPIAGIDLDDYTPAPHSNSEDITVGTVGRLTEPKNPWMILDVAERSEGMGISFEIAGDGDLDDDLRAEIQARGLSNVSLRGRIDDVPAFLETLDIYFQPSLWEGLCITVLEAMAAGLPVVGSNVGGIGRNVRHRETGLLYKPDDVKGFTEGIAELAADADRREKLGLKGRDVVSERYTRESLVTEFEKAIGTR